MKKFKIVLILRGRPGLGHIVQPYFIGDYLAKLGHDILFISYGQGVNFIENSNSYELINLKMDKKYSDWPGLDMYPEGIKKIIPIIETYDPDFIIFGGEYFLLPILKILNKKGAIFFNPKTFLKKTHSKSFKKFLYYNFNMSDIVISYDKIPKNIKEKFKIKILEGPFEYYNSNTFNHKYSYYVIANGGGCDFPIDLKSYSINNIKPIKWIKQTYDFTYTSIKTIKKYKKNDEKIFIFSALPKKLNNKLKKQFKCKNIIFYDVSVGYHEILPKAKLFISRAGVSTVADAKYYNRYSILWTLFKHNEQSIQTDKSDYIYYVNTIKDLIKKIKYFHNIKLNEEYNQNLLKSNTKHAANQILSIIEDKK